MLSFLRAVALAVTVGIALGVAGQTGSDLHPGMRWVVALGVPWLVTAFVAGALLGGRVRGAFAGATALVVGTLVYYALRLALGGGGPYVLPVLALAAIVAVGAALTEDSVRDALRGVGWRGA